MLKMIAWALTLLGTAVGLDHGRVAVTPAVVLGDDQALDFDIGQVLARTQFSVRLARWHGSCS